ncbi:MAG: S-methyl-5'-thioadenosine phosphorylase [Nitrospinota bacterium]|nr:MAG: S-methyl-5'-thioadenosine phosphorylase [Nitrospinota bacterium]
MTEARIGIIGGSGLYRMQDLQITDQVKVDTPFGEPSDAYLIGKLAGREVVFLSRHGQGHRLVPSALNFRANIYGMKKLGVEWIISVSAVGSMQERIRPGDIVVPDQFFDRTKNRIQTFFPPGIAVHIAFADPVCPHLSRLLFEAGCQVGASMHAGGTYLCIEGPQFSTRAESRIYRQWGVDIIGMTNIPEAKLAREAEICYATLALVTDYDCWHEEEEDVSVESILQIMQQNVQTAQRIIGEAVSRFPLPRDCPCAEALKGAIVTSPEAIPEPLRQEYALLIGKYMTGTQET